MSVIAEFSIPAEDFILGKALQQTAGLAVELEKMIPTGNTEIPYFWVLGERTEAFDTVLDREPEISSFDVVDEIDSRRLYRAEWNSTADTFVQAIGKHDAVLQEASGDATSWTFQIRFPDSHVLSEFHTYCRERDIRLSVDSLYNPIEPAAVDLREMTEAQRSLVERAYDEGFFDVPRKITLAEIADDLGLSDQAVNERLRRGLKALVGATLKSESE
jgi:hypothetical protein